MQGNIVSCRSSGAHSYDFDGDPAYRQTHVVALTRTKLGFGLHLDAHNAVLGVKPGLDADRSGGFEVGDRVEIGEVTGDGEPPTGALDDVLPTSSAAAAAACSEPSAAAARRSRALLLRGGQVAAFAPLALLLVRLGLLAGRLGLGLLLLQALARVEDLPVEDANLVGQHAHSAGLRHG